MLCDGPHRAGSRVRLVRRVIVLRLVIAEDSVLLREGLTRLLTDRGLDVVAGVTRLTP